MIYLQKIYFAPWPQGDSLSRRRGEGGCVYMYIHVCVCGVVHFKLFSETNRLDGWNNKNLLTYKSGN